MIDPFTLALGGYIVRRVYKNKVKKEREAMEQELEDYEDAMEQELEDYEDALDEELEEERDSIIHDARREGEVAAMRKLVNAMMQNNPPQPPASSCAFAPLP